MIDQFLIIAATDQWADARYRVLPEHPLDPVVWMTHDNVIRMWHPLMPPGAHEGLAVAPEWDEASFRQLVGSLSDALRQNLAARAEDIGVPGDYYAQYPDIVQRIHRRGYKLEGLGQALHDD